MKHLSFIFFAFALTATSVSAETEIKNLSVCGLKAPIGLDCSPTFAWQTESTERGFVQQAYRIVVATSDGKEVWDSGRVEGRNQNDIKYEGESLISRNAYKWTVTVWGNDGSESEETSTFETAFLSPEEWKASWIAPDEGNSVRTRFDVPMTGQIKARYIKVNMTSPGQPASTDLANSHYQLTEIEIISNGVNVAKGCNVLSDHDWNKTWPAILDYGWAPQYLTDGIIVGATNGYTSWQLQNQSDKSAYVTIDLGQERDVEAITIYPRQSDCTVDGSHACNFPTDFTIESSSDNKAYDIIYAAKAMEAPEYADVSSRIPYIANTFTVPTGKIVKRARMYATALGVFTMEIDGKPVTDARLEPGETSYDKTVLYSTYDVTNLLHEGENRILAQVAGGIYNVTNAPGRYTKPEIHNTGTPSLKAELHVEYTDGTTDVMLTDENWRTALSPTIVSNWWGGEDYNAMQAFDTRDISSWAHVKIVQPTTNLPIEKGGANPIGVLKSRDYEPLRVVETWKAVKVNRLGEGHYVVDFGRNFAGQYTFTLKGERGEYIRLQPGETLDPDGGCNIQYYYSSNSLTYDAYTFAGNPEGETWGPTFMYHGFRYLEITGLTHEPKPEDFTALRIRSDMAQVSEFMTSNSLINQIHTICRDAIQSQLYNSVTDCPQREKLGWMEVPGQMYNSLVYNYDMEAFWRKVLLDCFDAQTPTGKVPSTAPHYMNVYDDDPNWGGSSVVVPYRSLRTYGDLTTVERYYDNMKRLVDYYTSLTTDHIMPGKEYSVLSDWGQNTCGLAQETAPEFTITTTYYYLLRIMGEMAELTGHNADAISFNETADQVKIAFNRHFFNPETCVYGHGNQAEYGMALYYGLVDDKYREQVVDNLVKSVVNANYKIKTGEIGLKPMLMSLADNGRNDVVWRMACQTDYPSYGYWVMQGCTTTPEYWDLSLSQNHCMMDHIEEWFFSELGGIKNAGTGFDSLVIKPYTPTDLNQLRIATQSVHGQIVSSYERAGNGIRYSFTIPSNSKATIVVPLAKGCNVLTENNEPLQAGKNGIASVSYTDSLATVVVGSGTYSFTSGVLDDENHAAQEAFWTPVSNASQLMEGSMLKIQEQNGRYLGTCSGHAQSEGGFVTGSTFDQTPILTVKSIITKDIDEIPTQTLQLVNDDSGFGFGLAQADNRMLGWRKKAEFWGFDMENGIAKMFRGDKSVRNGGYVFFYDKNINSGINLYGSETQAAQFQIHKFYPIDSTEVLVNGNPFTYYRQCGRSGGYETICLPIDVTELPTDYDFFRPVSLNEGVLTIEPVESLVAGEPYLMRYTGSVQSIVPITTTFSGIISCTAPKTNVLISTFEKVSAAEGLYALQSNGNSFVPATNDIYPFRAYIKNDENWEDIKINESTTGITSQHVQTEKGRNGIYTIGGVKVEKISRPGLYIINGRKVIVTK